jgi:hypothetical protein
MENPSIRSRVKRITYLSLKNATPLAITFIDGAGRARHR